jgi:hypothetical protein
MRSAANVTRLHELRLDWGFVDRELVLDATMTVFADGDGEHGSPARVALCHGARVWQPFSDRGGFESEALAWLQGEKPSPALPHPGDLTTRECVELWRKALIRRLKQGIGDRAFHQLVGIASRPDHLVRIVVRPRDHLAARLPVEVLCSLDGTPQHAVSVLRLPVRLADSITRPGMAAREPGVYSAALLRTYDASDEESGRLGALTTAFARSSGLLQIRCTGTERQFERFDEETLGSVREADLVLLAGHGTADCALRVAAGDDLDVDSIAGALAGGPSSVVLAICRSAVARAPDAEMAAQPSLAEAVASQGAAITIGFQGEEVEKKCVSDFVETAFDALGPLLTTPDRSLTLLDWELALCDARFGRPGLDPIAPVAFVHPMLLTGASIRAPEPSRVPRGRLTYRAPRLDETEATCWYVPGQIACFAASSAFDARQLRVPLPVDCGVDLRVSLAQGAHVDPRQGGDHHSVTLEDLVRLGHAFDLGGRLGITLELTARPVDSRWANRAAELSAAMRGLSAITTQPVPAAALQLLHAAVRDTWGAPDGAPRVIDIQSGQAVARLAPWPSLIVEPHGTVARSAPPIERLPGLPPAPPATLLGALTAADVLKLIRDEYKRLNGSGDSSRVRGASRMNAVANPAEATVRLGAGNAGGVLTLEARDRRVRGPDEIYRSTRPA